MNKFLIFCALFLFSAACDKEKDTNSANSAAVSTSDAAGSSDSQLSQDVSSVTVSEDVTVSESSDSTATN